ncbi:MAG: IS66 family transposase, partial [Myxococcales bacterium]|nr:IS66 family transposase [Myxococcales bacterium]
MARHGSGSQSRSKQAELGRAQKQLLREVEKLKVAFDELKAGNEELRAGNDELRVGNARLRAENEALRETIVHLTHENQLLKRRLYGNKTERARTTETQLSFGELLKDEAALDEQLAQAVADAQSAAEANEAAAPAEPPGETPTPKQRGRRDLSTSKLPRVVVDFVNEQLEQQGVERIGFDEAFALMVKRASVSILVMRTAKYRLDTPSGPLIESAPRPKLLFPRGILHTSLVAQLLVGKFGLGTPFYRQEQQLAVSDAPIDRATMCRYAEEAGNTLGATVVHAMWRDALTASVLSTDATGAAIQPGKREQSRVQQACKRGHFFTVVADCDHVLFFYTEKHDHVTVKELFGEYRGFLQADASNVYDILDRGPPSESEEDKLKLVGCWAHCRRYFFEAAICKYPVGVEGLMRIRAMYEVDSAFKKFPPEKRRLLRDEHLRPLIDQFYEWVNQARFEAAGRSLAAKALNYAHNQESELRRVLDDPRLPLDNTRSERALRKVVVGRKNWLFYGSDVHAESAAALFSIIASCRL